MRRLSIRTLMAFVLIFAVGLAALRNANDLWAGVMLLFALAVVGVAVIGGVILRGRERCWWAGFAFFGGGYLALAIGPWFGSADQSRLVTTHLLESVRAKVVTSNIARFEMSALDRSSVRLRVMTDDGGVITKTMAKSVVNSTSHSDLLASMTPANRCALHFQEPQITNRFCSSATPSLLCLPLSWAERSPYDSMRGEIERRMKREGRAATKGVRATSPQACETGGKREGREGIS